MIKIGKVLNIFTAGLIIATQVTCKGTPTSAPQPQPTRQIVTSTITPGTVPSPTTIQPTRQIVTPTQTPTMAPTLIPTLTPTPFLRSYDIRTLPNGEFYVLYEPWMNSYLEKDEQGRYFVYYTPGQSIISHGLRKVYVSGVPDR